MRFPVWAGPLLLLISHPVLGQQDDRLAPIDEPPTTAATLEQAVRSLQMIEDPVRETLELDRRVRRLGRLRRPELVRHLIEMYELAPEPTRLLLLECFADIPLEQVRVFLETISQSEDWRFRAVAVTSLITDGHRRRSLKRLQECLEQEDYWQVRAAALDGVIAGGWYPPQVIPTLIDVLDREDGRLEQAALTALQSLSGHGEFGREASVWRDWFKGLQTRGTPATGRYRRPTYYGVPIDSRRPVFIIDTSGSMAQTMSMSLPTGRSWSPQVRPFLEFDGPVTRIGRARLELAQALVELEDQDRFGIVFFSSSAYPWKKELLPAQDHPQSAALERVLTLGGRGSTNIHQALEVALTVSHGENRRPGTEGPDTFFLLTDGVPTSGEIEIEDEIRSWFRRLNRQRHVRVHTFGIGAHARSLLRGLAADSGGTYVDLSH
ncbi:MAG: VWA domain-containing protein [Planctomycetota bacterium]